MQISTAWIWPIVAAIGLVACGHPSKPRRQLPPAPYTYLTLTACKSYQSNINECQLDYGAGFARQRLGPVQLVSRGLPLVASADRYQVSGCWPTDRIRRELPNFGCRIYVSTSGVDAGSVLIKGGTAVKLARILGDREQIGYRWKRDEWSRVRD